MEDKIVILGCGGVNMEMVEKAAIMAIDNAYYVKGKSTIGEPPSIPYVRFPHFDFQNMEPRKETRPERRARERKDKIKYK